MKTTLKVIGQILLILLAAGIIVGALYAVVHYNLLNLPQRGGPEGRNFQGQPPFQPGGSQGAAPNSRGGEGFGDRDGDHGPNLLRGMFGLIGSLIKLAVIVVGVLFAQTLFKNWQARKTPTRA
jgi:hypothetical protein